MKIAKKELYKTLQELLSKVERIEYLLSNAIPSVPENRHITVIEASAYVKLSVSTIYSKVSRHEIPVSKVGKRLYFCKSELDDWLRAGRKKTFQEIQDGLDFSRSLKKSSP